MDKFEYRINVEKLNAESELVRVCREGRYFPELMLQFSVYIANLAKFGVESKGIPTTMRARAFELSWHAKARADGGVAQLFLSSYINNCLIVKVRDSKNLKIRLLMR